MSVVVPDYRKSSSTYYICCVKRLPLSARTVKKGGKVSTRSTVLTLVCCWFKQGSLVLVLLLKNAAPTYCVEGALNQVLQRAVWKPMLHVPFAPVPENAHFNGHDARVPVCGDGRAWYCDMGGEPKS